MQKGLRKKSQFWLILVGLGLLGLLLYSKRGALDDSWETLKNANLALVLLLPIIQALNFLVLAKYYQSMLRLFKATLSTGYLWKLVAALTFVNQILPSGGVSGMAYVIYGFRRKVSAGVASLIQLGRYVLSWISYFLVMPLVLLLVVFDNQVDWLRDTLVRGFHSGKAIAVVGAFVALTMAAFILPTRKNLLDRFAGKLENGFNWALGLFKSKRIRRIKKGTIRSTLRDFSEGFEFFRSQGRRTLKPLGFMFMNAFFEMLIVVTAFAAVGSDVSIGVLFVSFLAANIAGVVSIIPGDIGVNESVMILMLSGLGVPDSVAISATLLYRVLNKSIFIIIGFFFFSRLLKPAAEQSA